MNVKINAVDGIDLLTQLKIVQDYLIQNGDRELSQLLTKKGCGIKIESCGRRYHIALHKTNKFYVFNIWWGV